MCYTYLLVNKINGMFYYGARYSLNANLGDILVTYFTSSKVVKAEIEKLGVDSFFCEIRRIFNSPEECLKWEHKVLRRLKASEREDCYNLSVGGSIFNSPKAMKLNNPMFNPEVIKRSVEGKKRSREAGRHKSSAAKELGRLSISENMKAKNPMKDKEIAAKMARTKILNKTTCSGTVWMANRKTKERKRVNKEAVDIYIEKGWIFLGNKAPIPDEVCQ